MRTDFHLEQKDLEVAVKEYLATRGIKAVSNVYFSVTDVDRSPGVKYVSARAEGTVT